MSVAGRDGAWVSAEELVQLDCTKCGVFFTGWIASDRETEEKINKHLREKHGGLARADR